MKDTNPPPLWNIEIDKWMKKNNIIYFFGCYTADTEPKVESYPSYFIFNYSPKWKEGTHWISILFLNKNLCYYYDPIGIPPEQLEHFFNYDTNFIKYMKKYSKKIIYNEKVNQYPFSNMCGYFCCVFIYSIDKLKFNMKQWNSYISYDLHQNEKTIYKIYKLLDK